MTDLAALNSELTVDPLTRGYSGMTDLQAANSLNDTVDRVVQKALVAGWEAFQATVDTEFDAMAASDRQEWLGICSIDSLEPANGKPAASTVLRLFGGGSATVTALQALRQDTVNRATELGLGRISEGDVNHARNL